MVAVVVDSGNANLGIGGPAKCHSGEWLSQGSFGGREAAQNKCERAYTYNVDARHCRERKT